MALARWRVPVRVRILAAILAVTAVGLVVAGGIAFFLQYTRVIDGIDAELHQELTGIETRIDGDRVGSVDGSAGTATVEDLSGFTNVDALVEEIMSIVSPPLGGSTLGLIDGSPAYGPGASTIIDLSDPDFSNGVAEVATSSGIVIGTHALGGSPVRYLAVPLAVDGDQAEGLFISGISVDSRLADLRSVIGAYAWAALGVLIVIGLVGWIVAGRLLRPVRELRTTAARITAGALDERIPVSGNDDLSDLTETINAMIARLEEAFRGQRRVLNDVRHELATPVTIVRGHLELVDLTDPADVAQTRDLAIDELDRMSGLIAQISHLAEAERSGAHAPRAVDVDELTRGVFAKIRVIPDRDWTLGSVARGEAFVDHERITQAWVQLADNAAKYSEPGTRIEIGSSLDRDGLRCWVDDDGPGIPDEARERIFERFGRATDSRGADGSGLGLSIVLALVHAHGGRVDLDTQVGRGSRFTVVLPRTPADPDDEEER
ncbi:MAG: sensor histidine kinase [Microbacterium gubbeenense]|uniref:sensor histidine kinase n=1 Tax=Microbacterium gubbeenense TaxID=159896 RepID=UPI0003FA7B0C|nr:HAMP domain-containing sensor histidine kinase [Microbacterium gubbeenense]